MAVRRRWTLSLFCRYRVLLLNLLEEMRPLHVQTVHQRVNFRPSRIVSISRQFSENSIGGIGTTLLESSVAYVITPYLYNIHS